jgi:nitrile hydratase accessory protein
MVSDPGISPLLSRALPNFDDTDLIFAEPWEARAFAIIVNLAQAGHFTWGEWVDCFSQEVASATAAEASGALAKTYYEQWLDAAETLLVAKGVTSRSQLLAKRFAIGAVGPAHVIA